MKRMLFRKGSKSIKFDDFTDNTKEYKSYWVGMCPCCLDKYKGILNDRVSDGGSGVCSVYGCNEDAEYYVDFDRDEVVFEEV